MATTGIILGAAYMLYLYRRVIFGKLEKDDLRPFRSESAGDAIFAPLIVLLIWMGIWPAPFREVMDASIANLIEQHEVAMNALIRHGGRELGGYDRYDHCRYHPVLPELFLAVAAMVLMYGVFRGDKSTGSCSWLAFLALIVTGVIITVAGNAESAFRGQFVVDQFALHEMAGASWLRARGRHVNELQRTRGNRRFEFPVLICCARHAADGVGE